MANDGYVLGNATEALERERLGLAERIVVFFRIGT